MPRPLPSRPSFELLKKQAKELRRAFAAGQSAACERIQISHPDYTHASMEEITQADLSLRDAQLIIAREYGFDNWDDLKKKVYPKATTSSAPTIEELETAYRKSPNDDETVRALDRLYVRHGNWVEAGKLFEQAAEARSDWRIQIWYLKRAVARFNHIKDWKSCVRCHRRSIALLPGDLSPHIKLNIWCPAGLAIPYPHLGVAEEALSQIDELGKAIGEAWSVYGRFVFHLARSLVYRELGDWDKVLEEGRRFVEWAKTIPETDPQLNRIAASIDEEGDPVLAGESGRCYCICNMLTHNIAKGEFKKGYDSTKTFAELNLCLANFEEFYQEMQRRSRENPGNSALRNDVETYKRRLTTCFDYAGRAAHETQRYENAIQYFNSEEELTGSHYADGPFYRAASLVALGRVEEARDQLKELSGSWVTNGRGLTLFAQIKEFDSIREDSHIMEIVQEWK